MKKSFYFLIQAVLLVSSVARGQLDVRLTMANTTFLRFEPVLAGVTIRNNSAMQIQPGGSGGYSLQFDVRDSDGHPVSAIEKHPPLALVLAPGSETTVTNDLFRCVRLADFEQGNVIARVDYAGQSFLSAKIYFDIRNGSEIARLQVASGSKQLTHTLRTLNRRGHEHLFLRVDEESGGWTYGATDLGYNLQLTPPTFLLGATSTVHILQRSGPREYKYHVADANGTLTRAEVFSGDYRTVKMYANSKGEIVVNGMPGDKRDNPPVLQATPFTPGLHR